MARHVGGYLETAVWPAWQRRASGGGSAPTIRTTVPGEQNSRANGLALTDRLDNSRPSHIFLATVCLRYCFEATATAGNVVFVV